MEKKVFFITTLLLGFILYAKSQIGVSSLALATPGNSLVGSSSNIGKSNLPVCKPRQYSCSNIFTYTFIGNGNWNIESNWLENIIPPAILTSGSTIIIDNIPGGEAILNVPQTISAGANLRIMASRRLKVLSDLTIQN